MVVRSVIYTDASFWCSYALMVKCAYAARILKNASATPVVYLLDALVYKTDQGLIPSFSRRLVSRTSSTSDLNTGTLLVTLPNARPCSVGVETD